MSKLFFFRHAQASYGAANYDQLSEKGIEQSAILGKHLVDKGFQFDRVYVGTLERQKHTFEIVKEIYEKNNKTFPKPIYLEALREHQGPKASTLALEKLKETVPQVKQWMDEIEANPALTHRNRILYFQYFMNEWTSGNIEIDEVQSWKKFRDVVRAGLKQILNQTQKGENIAAFTSGGTISSIVAESLNMQDEYQIATLNFSIRNTSYSSFLYSNKQFNLLSVNELPHLEGEMVTFV